MASKEVKSRIKASKTKHDLHVLVLMEREDLSKAEATVLAYLQGYEALSDQLAPKPEPMRDVLDPELDKAATEAAFKAAGGKLAPKPVDVGTLGAEVLKQPAAVKP